MPGLPSTLRIAEADLSSPKDQAAVLVLIDEYARDPFGGGESLGADVRNRLISGLQRHPTTLILIGWCETRPVAIAVCFGGFSTFAARPLLNIHDFMVVKEYRGLGVGRQMLQAVEAKARELGCCKLTLEVLDRNDRAMRTYRAAGFGRYVLQDDAGAALFLVKPLE
ncbi:GNAT family N-acetyltransferase [Opitutus sp. ER46]|nr:GNAT family N-acetyltransferase [Opitutus sp. ER46]